MTLGGVMAKKKTIKLSVDFWQNLKTKKTVDRLGLEAVRSLQIFWSYAVNHIPDGNLTDISAEDFELRADWHGKRGDFYNLCLEIWIEHLDNGTLLLHDWSKYNGKPFQDAAEIYEAPAVVNDIAVVELGSREAVIELPVIKSEYCSTQDGVIYLDEMTEWQKTYISVDIGYELKKMKLWLENNPGRRKTARGIRKFIHSWLDRAQNQARREPAAVPVSVYQQRMKTQEEMAGLLLASSMH